MTESNNGRDQPDQTNSNEDSKGKSVRGPTSALTSFLKEKGIKPRNVSIYTRVETEDQIEPESTSLTQLATTEPSRKTSRKRPVKKLEESDSDDGFNEGLPKKRSCIKCCRMFVGSHLDRFCSACLAAVDQAVISKWDREASTSAATTLGKKKGKKKQTIDVMLDTVQSVGVLPLTELCVRQVCYYIDNVAALGDIPPDSKFRIAKILSKMRRLDHKTFLLFCDSAESDLRLYDCTLLTPREFNLIPRLSPCLSSIYLSFCGRLTDENIMQFAHNLPLLRSVTLKGCFLVTDGAFSRFFETIGCRLEHLCLENAAKFGQQASKALVEHCPGITTLSLRHCSSVGGSQVSLYANLRHLHEVDLSWSGVGHPSQLMDNIENTKVSSTENATLKHKDSELWELTDSHIFHNDDNATNASEAAEAAKKQSAFITDESIAKLLQAQGSQLSSLMLSQVSGLSSSVLSHFSVLTKLSRIELDGIPVTTDDFKTCFGEALLFPHLKAASFRNCYEIDDDACAHFLTLYGPQLVTLNVSGLYQLGPKSLNLLGTNSYSSKLEQLDLSWVRALDDVLLQSIIYGTKSDYQVISHRDQIEYFATPFRRSISKITLFGCFLLTAPVVKTVYKRCKLLLDEITNDLILESSKQWQVIDIVGSEFD